MKTKLFTIKHLTYLKIAYVCLFCIYTSIGAQAQVLESNNLDIILQKARVGDLVVFDIDNTISNPKTDLGSSEWLEQGCKKVSSRRERI